MGEIDFKTPLELQVLLGERLRRLRRTRGLDRRSTAERAGISEKALASWAEFAGEAGLSAVTADRVAADFCLL